MYRAPRGTADILPQEQPYWSWVTGVAEATAKRYGYAAIDTPVFEEAGLFVRTIGAGTDIVEKETYTFPDRGGDLMTLRPEGTAPVCRAYIEHGMHSLPQPVRLYYITSIFRYERPQKGRYRQHHQFGCEALGDPDPAVDAEVIELAWRLLEGLGLKELSLRLNSIGCQECKPAYRERLRDYYAPLQASLCRDCQARLERNTLRLLDCKQEGCQMLSQKAPRSLKHLCPECLKHWESLLGYLGGMGLSYDIDHRLVRGLDYYTRTVFEIQPPEEGAQSTIVGGGRYDGLVQELGGRPTPGVGFATGLERIIQNLRRQGITPPETQALDYFVAYLGEEAKAEAVKLASRIREAGLSAVLSRGGSLKAQLRQANALGADSAVIIGEEELRSGSLVIRDMKKGEQKAESVVEFFKGLERRAPAS